MSPSTSAGASLGQAIYTWSRSRLDRTRGMGFCVISSALETDIDWLAKLNPPEFQLFHEDVEAHPELYEARVGFSEVGRTVVDGKAIIYRKTADGSVDDANRPQLVVHALIGSAATLGLSRISQIREEIWIREVNSSALREVRLADCTLADVIASSDPHAEHACPDDHKGALRFLRLIADKDLGEQNLIKIQYGHLRSVFLAFPVEVADGFSLDPYVAVGGVERDLTLRAPDGSRGGSLSHAEEAADGTTSSGGCALLLAVHKAAEQFLYCTEPSFSSYARAVLDNADRPAKPTAPAGAPGPGRHAAPAAPAQNQPDSVQVLNPVLALLDEVRTGEEYLTEQANRALLNLLTPSHASSLLQLDDAALTEIFAKVSDKNLIWSWRGYFKDEPADTFTKLWNRTHVAAFLGIVLTKNLAASDGSARISPGRGLSPDATAEVLRLMREYKFGGRALALVIDRGYGDAGATRQFIARTFDEDAMFLFDGVLSKVNMPATHMIDYLRFDFDQWSSYRKIPGPEAEALREMLQPTFFEKVKVIFKR